MPAEEDVWKAAHEMVERYGAAASDEVEKRIRELRDHGEKEAIGLWLEIRKAVASLNKTGQSKPN